MQRRVNAWRQQIEVLALQYLDWKRLGPLENGVDGEDISTWHTDVMSFGGMSFTILHEDRELIQ